MKKFLAALSGAVIVALAACSSIPTLPTNLINAAGAVQSVAQTVEGVDFKSGEVLCSDGAENDALDMSYQVATILTPASPATKNQAQVLFVGNGEKAWASFVVPSHKAAKAELTVGKLVYRPSGYSDYDAKNVDAQTYRQLTWILERVTSVDELFKNRVEVGGSKYDPALIRIPEISLE